MYNNVDKREKSLAEFIVIIVLMALLMAIFIKYFFQQEEQITSAGFNNLAQNFNSTVMAVHAQWLMENKPDFVKLSLVNNESSQRVSVNQNGWLDIKEQNSVCENIWQLAMAIPMSLMKLSVAVIEVRNNDKSSNFHQCRYLLPSGHYFDYNSATGKVSKVKSNY